MLFITIFISKFLFLSPVGSQKIGIEIEDNQINDTVSVRQFGEKGDGVNDDRCKGYWTEDVLFHEGKFNPQEWMVQDMLNNI